MKLKKKKKLKGYSFASTKEMKYNTLGCSRENQNFESQESLGISKPSSNISHKLLKLESPSLRFILELYDNQSQYVI